VYRDETPNVKFDGAPGATIADDAWVWEVARDGGPLWDFQFGGVGTLHVLVYGGNLDAALELAAGVLEEEGWVGHLTSETEMQELYKEAAEDLDLTLENGRLFDDEGEEVDWDDQLGNEVRETAEADMTYTESGWLTSYEWAVREIYPPDPLYGAGVVAWATLNLLDTLDDETDEEVTEILASTGASSAGIAEVIAAIQEE